MAKKKQLFTWADLKKACNELPDEFLNEEVMWWGDERGGTIHKVRLLDCEMVCTEEGWEQKTAIEEDTEMYPPEDIAALPLLKIGHPVLYTE